jgi:hypothetical protein
VAVLVLTGLLALYVAVTGLRKVTLVPLFVLYTFSWSMSMLDSYQHHYLVSLILFCLIFFPNTPATEIHPLPLSESDGERQSHKQQRELARHAQTERTGAWYALFVALACVVYAFVRPEQHTWVAFFLFAAAIGLGTWFYAPEGRVPRLNAGFGFSLLGTSMAIVYTYTAIAKMDANWIAGHTILQITASEREFARIASFAAGFGIERERFWSIFATCVIPQELLVGATYLLAVHQDRLEHRVAQWCCLLAFVLAVALHVGAEAMALDIGWFSYYMLLTACCFLLPLAVVDKLAMVFTWPARWVERRLRMMEGAGTPPRVPALVVSVAGSLVLVVVGELIDLPGASAACAIAAVTLFGGAMLALLGPDRRDPRRFAFGAIVAGLAMWAAIASSPVRWDFYRYLAGDLSRRGELQAALEIYERGESYAPPGESRMDKIKELRRKLAK